MFYEYKYYLNTIHTFFSNTNTNTSICKVSNTKSIWILWVFDPRSGGEATSSNPMWKIVTKFFKNNLGLIPRIKLFYPNRFKPGLNRHWILLPTLEEIKTFHWLPLVLFILFFFYFFHTVYLLHMINSFTYLQHNCAYWIIQCIPLPTPSSLLRPTCCIHTNH